MYWAGGVFTQHHQCWSSALEGLLQEKMGGHLLLQRLPPPGLPVLPPTRGEAAQLTVGLEEGPSTAHPFPCFNTVAQGPSPHEPGPTTTPAPGCRAA